MDAVKTARKKWEDLTLCNEGQNTRRITAAREFILTNCFLSKISREEVLGQVPLKMQYYVRFIIELFFKPADYLRIY